MGPVNLFRTGIFVLHAGEVSSWKVDCDALTDADWHTLAEIAAEMLPPFDTVVGIPRGGIKFAAALERFVTPNAGRRLIADDVLTTGSSMIDAMTEGLPTSRKTPDIGIVVFARGPLPRNVTAIWRPGNPLDETGW